MFLLFFISPLVGLLDGLGISILIPIFTGFIGGGELPESNAFTEVVSNFFSEVHIPNTLQNLLVAAIVIILVKAILKFSHTSIAAVLNGRLMSKLRSLVINGLSEMKFSNYLTLNTGYVLNTGVSEINKYAAGMIAFLESINTLFILLGYMVAILLVSWKSSLYIMLIGGLLSFVYSIFNRLSKGYSREVSANNREYSKYLIEMVNFFKYLKATDRFGYLQQKLKRNINSLKRLLILTEINRYMPTILQEPLSIILIGGLFYMNSEFLHEPVSVLLIVLGLSYRMATVVSQFQGRKQNFYALIGSLESVSVLLNNIESEKELSPNQDDIIFKENIKIEGLSFGYSDNERVLNNIDLSISCKETVAFVGASGAGKSTLIDILAGLLNPNSGTIYIDGKPYQNLCLPGWRHHIGYVTQESIVFDTSILENLIMEEGGTYDEELLKSAIQNSNSSNFIELSESGLSKDSGDKGLRLSGGQRQRLSLARELYRTPNILILDEATSALDSNSEMVIKESLEKLKGKTTIIIIAHRLATVKNADRIFVLDKGVIAESGRFEELIQNPNSKFYDLAIHQNL
jgi:ABC-type bacteriocin/lantibiotic exporter with double-glycine peptidase domain